MTGRLRALWVTAAVGGLAGCTLDDLGGGGGAGGAVSFTQGFVFVRKDDRNVYVADKSDFNQSGRLSSAGAARHPTLSKSGKQVAFVAGVGGSAELMVVPTDASLPPSRVLAAELSRANFRSPAFSPDGTQLAFALDQGGASAIGVVGVDGSGFRVISGGGGASYDSPTFYPDGAAVLAITGNSLSGYTQLVRLPLAGSAATTVAASLGGEAIQVANRAVLSPDGTQAVFDGRVSSGAVRIFVVALNSGAVTHLTDYPTDPDANDSFPCWVGADQVGFSLSLRDTVATYALPSNSVRSSGGVQVAGATEPWYGPN